MRFKLPLIGQVTTGSDSEPKQLDAKTSKKMVDTILGGFLSTGRSGLSGESTISTKLLEANKEWVYRNNDVIAKEVAELEFVLYRMGLKNGEIVFNEIDDHPILDALDRFNSTTTKSDALYNTQSHKKLTGDSFWYLDFNGNVLRNIFVLEPDKIELDIGDPTDATDDLVEGYKYKDNIKGKKVEHYYSREEIIHFKTPNPNNMFRGFGAVEAAAEVIDIDNLTNKTTRQFFEKGAITNFVLTSEERIDPEQLARLKAEMRSAYAGVNNAYQTMILGGGLKPEKISFSNRDMEFLAQLEWYRDKIMVIFGNTKASLGIIDDVNRASHESSIISWKRNSIKPEMKAIVDTLNEFLVPRFGDNLVLGFKDPIPEDRSAKIEEVKVLVATDVITADEARELLGYEPRKTEGATTLDREKPQPEMPELPPPLKNINLNGVIRRSPLPELKRTFKEMKQAATPLAREYLKAKKRRMVSKQTSFKNQLPEHNEHEHFTDDEVWGYWNKQIQLVQHTEERFENTVKQFLSDLEAIVLSNLEQEVNRKTIKRKQLYNTNALIEKAELDFTPILMEEVVAAGQQALSLVGVEEVYMPYSIRDAVRYNVRKFSKSMLDTDRKKLTDVIAVGIDEGKSMAEIRRQIQDAFDSMRKNQARLITQTEVIKASNMASVDAFEQSGVVEAKQWLTAEDDRVDEKLCKPMNGRIIDLDGKFFKKGDSFNGFKFDYESIRWPPIHAGCRCTILPVLVRTPVGGAKTDLLTAYHGEGHNLDNGNYALGDGFYVSRDKNIAATFGKVSKLDIPINEKDILKINTEDEYQEFINAVIHMFPGEDINKSIPAYVKAKGYKAAEIKETVDPLGGIALYEKKLVAALRASLEHKGMTKKEFQELENERLRIEKEDLEKKLKSTEEYTSKLEKIAGIEK